MKILFFALIISFIAVTPAYAQLLSDATGIVNRIDVEIGGHVYEIQVISNFQITGSDFDDDNDKLTIHIESGIQNNLGEMVIPQQIFDGELIFYLDGKEITPKINSNESISFVTLEFSDVGKHALEILTAPSADALPVTGIPQNEESESSSTGGGGGCLIATATYGSELAPQVQQLRELRNHSFLETTSGKIFLDSFNTVYYSFSPSVADLERQNPIFKESIKLLITPMISTLSILNHVDIDSEETVVGYGIGIILLNVGMYFVAPALGIVYGRRILLK